MEEHDGRPPPELVDTHCHLNFARYDADRPAVLARAKAAGVRRSIIPAVDIAGSREIVALCAEWGECYGAVGIHPNSSADCEGEQLVSALREMEALANARDILAIGEIGLDFYRDHADPAQQERVLRAQLQLAAQLELPVILHNRDATSILLPILEEWATELPAPLRERAGVLHSFSGEWSDAERALAAGFYLGFSGPLTYPSAAGLRRVAARAPPGAHCAGDGWPFPDASAASGQAQRARLRSANRRATGVHPRCFAGRNRCGNYRQRRAPLRAPLSAVPGPAVPPLSVIIVSWNVRELLAACLEEPGGRSGIVPARMPGHRLRQRRWQRRHDRRTLPAGPPLPAY